MTDISKSEVSRAVPDQIDVGPPPVRLSGGRSSRGLLVTVAVLIALGCAAAFAWMNYGDRISEMAAGAAAQGAPTSVGDSVSAVEFTAFQAQIQASLLAANQQLAAQQSEFKRLSDQIAGLTARIDGLQGSVAAAAPPAPTLAAPTPPAPAAPRPTAPRKRPPAPPSGGISVGGAPLPGAR